MLRYESISKSTGNKKFVSAVVAADNGDSQALYVAPSTPFQQGIAVGTATLQNRSGSTCQVGLAVRLPTSLWEAGQITSAGVYTADTTDAQDVGAGDFPLHDRADSGSGFLVGCGVPFNTLGIVQSVSGDQSGATLIAEYFNGTSWVDITSSLLIADAIIGDASAEKVLCWPLPPDMAVSGDVAGQPATKYNARIRHTTTGAGASNPAASQIFVGFSKMQIEGLTNNGIASLTRDHEFCFPPQGDALFGVFSTASPANMAEVDVRLY